MYANIIHSYYHHAISKDINHSTNHVARVATLTSPVWDLYHQVHPAFQHHSQAFADYFHLSQQQLLRAFTVVAILHDSGNGHGDTSACTNYEEKDRIWETLSAQNTETCILSLHKNQRHGEICNTLNYLQR